MANSKIVYLELPAIDIPAMKQFYGPLFGWNFQDFGSDYAAFSESGIEGGLNGDASNRTNALLAVIQTEDIEDMEKKIRHAGASITVPIFSFPGGRRFHFTDPAGNELAVMQVAASS